MTVAQRLHEAVSAVCPIFGVRVTADGAAAPDYNGASVGQIAAAEAVIAGFDWSTEAHNAWRAAKAREQAKGDFDFNRVDRALASLIVDELNAHAVKIKAILDAVDGATTLANLKTAVATITDQPQRTLNQLVTALKNKIDADA